MSALINVLLGLIVIGLAIALTITMIKLSNVNSGETMYKCGTGTKPDLLGLKCISKNPSGEHYRCGPGTKGGPQDEICVPDLDTICTGRLEPGPENNCVIKAGECASPDGTQNICTEQCCVRSLDMKWENGVCKPKDGFALCPNDKMSSGGLCVDVPTIDSTSELSCGDCTVKNSDGTQCIMSTDPSCAGTGTGNGTGAQAQGTTDGPSKTARDAAIVLAVLASIVGVVFYFTKMRPETKTSMGNAAAGAWGAARGGASSAWGATRGGASSAFGATGRRVGSVAGAVSSRIPGTTSHLMRQAEAEAARNAQIRQESDLASTWARRVAAQGNRSSGLDPDL